MKRVYILLVNWNGWRDTIECLESVLRLDAPEYRIIVCDNGSGDDSLERIKAWAAGELSPPLTSGPLARFTSPPVLKPIAWVEFDRSQAEAGGDPRLDPPLILIRTGANLGFAGGNNVGLRYILARGAFDYVWLLNNDTVVPADSLSRLVEQAESAPATGICGSTLLYYESPQQVQALGGGYYCRWLGLPWLFGRWRRYRPEAKAATRLPRLMNYVVGASMLVSRRYLEEVGLMDERYFLFFEETDWAWRGQERFRLGWAPESLVYHKVGRAIGTSSDPRRKSLLCDFYALRNRLVFTRRHCPAALFAIRLSLVAACLLRLVFWQTRHARMILDVLRGRDAHWEKTVQTKTPDREMPAARQSAGSAK